jgi:hypothetical protein
MEKGKIFVFLSVVTLGLSAAVPSLAAVAQSSSGPIDALLLNTHLYSEMPACMSNLNGALAIISDSATGCNAGAGTPITAGGNPSNKCLARCDGASGQWVLASGSTSGGGDAAPPAGYTQVNPQASPNDSRFGTDMSCTAGSTSCNSPTVQITSSDIGKNIVIAGAGGSTAQCCGAQAAAYVPFTTTIASGSSGGAIVLSSAPPTSVTNAMWMLWPTTDDTSRFQSTVNGGNMWLNAGYYALSQSSANGGTSGMTVPSNTTIACAPGAIILLPRHDTDGNIHAAVVFQSSDGGGTNGCTFQGINAAGTAYGHGSGSGNPSSAAPHNWGGSGGDYPILVASATGANHGGQSFYNNTFRNVMGYAAIHVYGDATSSYSYGVLISNNPFSECSNYGPDTDSAQNVTIAYNTLTDCGIANEPDTSSYFQLGNSIVGNTMKYSLGNGYESSLNALSGFALFIAGLTNTAPSNGGTNWISGNVCDGGGVSGSDAITNQTGSPYPQFANNIEQNGCTCNAASGQHC